MFLITEYACCKACIIVNKLCAMCCYSALLFEEKSCECYDHCYKSNDSGCCNNCQRLNGDLSTAISRGSSTVGWRIGPTLRRRRCRSWTSSSWALRRNNAKPFSGTFCVVWTVENLLIWYEAVRIWSTTFAVAAVLHVKEAWVTGPFIWYLGNRAMLCDVKQDQPCDHQGQQGYFQLHTCNHFLFCSVLFWSSLVELFGLISLLFQSYVGCKVFN